MCDCFKRLSAAQFQFFGGDFRVGSMRNEALFLIMLLAAWKA